ncbi:DNA-binding protein [Methanotrichaceae archaeon M04Ac]|uniref:DNA-binding protein n=1 Tax=Candidatus Methanocrinis alkalitolerans TaxID=3033395 RepID=A0ABT5XE29_9EURY|nr:PPC domain-containing DNA-binding protein [Candidatus Methanocrinis alkalitolerans]MDF0592953.1 DNA-binding protein [Candidatus Methanocrinis alkalitolerans]
MGSSLSIVHELTPGRLFLASLDHVSEIVASITALAESLGVEAGIVSGIGALKDAVIGYYDQVAHEYRSMEIGGPVEISSLSGNISIRDGKPFLHIHATLADSQGNDRGGHLSSGTVFAAEVYIRELVGRPPTRSHDPTTGLFLWSETY